MSQPHEAAAAFRVSLAKHVLEQLNQQRLSPSTNTFCAFHVPEDFNDEQTFEETMSRVHHAQVSAGGALFVSLVDKSEKLAKVPTASITNVGSIPSSMLFTALSEHFSEQQLSMIEGAFVGHVFDVFDSDLHPRKLSSMEYADCLQFYSSHETVFERLEAIMQNIVSNEGTFNPTAKAVQHASV